MYLERGIVRTYRWSDGLSTIPDNQNTLTRQYANTNDAPRDPLHGPVTHIRIKCPNNLISEIVQILIISNARGHFSILPFCQVSVTSYHLSAPPFFLCDRIY